MANRYWVGGSGNWNSTDTSKWSDTAGGAAGASVPTSADDVYINTAGNTINVVGAVNCAKLFIQNAAGTTTITGLNTASINAYSAISVATSNLTGFDGVLNAWGTAIEDLAGTSTSTAFFKNVDVKGKYVIKIENTNYNPGTFKVSSGGEARFLTLPLYYTKYNIQGGTVTNSGIFLYCSELMELTSTGGIDTVVMVPTTTCSVVNNGFISSVLLAPVSTGTTINLSGSGTITSFAKQAGNTDTKALTLVFATSSSLKFGSFALSGNATTTITVRSSVSGIRAGIQYTGSGTVSTSYMNVADMQVTPDLKWISYNSTNAGNNFQWYFDTFTKPTSNLFFGSHI